MIHATQPKRFAIVGGGISGIAAALELETLRPADSFVLFEASQRLGGVLDSRHHDGFLIETSADMFTTEPSTAFDLVRRLGRESELVTTKRTTHRAYVATETGVEPIPSGFSLMLPGDVSAVLASNILSADGKARFLQEEQIPPLDSSIDESLQSFAIRRFGREVFERLIQPLASGIYTADPQTLSMRATMDRFLKLESQYGSLIGAGKAAGSNVSPNSQTSGARYGLFRAPKKGMSQLVDWMTTAIERTKICLGRAVTSIDQTQRGWKIDTADDATEFDGLILATSAAVSGRLLTASDNELGSTLSTIIGASSAIVVQSFDSRQIPYLTAAGGFQGYGVIVPSYLNRPVIASSFSSNKFPGRAPGGKLLVRSFIGGALHPEMVDQSDSQLAGIAVDQLRQTLQLSGQPLWTEVFRWHHCMPQYTMDHLDRVDRIQHRVSQIVGLELAGNSYRGVGIPACIESGTAAARRLAANW